MSQDTNVSNLIINKLTKQQFEGITNPDPTQLYFITDEGDSISTLDDVSISSLANGQVLQYNSTSSKWENVTIVSAPDIDNLSITQNSSDELQTVGVIDSNNTTSAIKTWTGTRAQYDAITTKDSTTIYNITDDQSNINTFFRSIGQIVPSAVPLTDSGLHLLDGSLINGSGVYAGFIDYIAALYGDGTNVPDYFCSESDWQTAVTTYGVCGKFVYDSVNNTVRLPKITGILEGTTDVTALGDLVEAGLPNITGRTINIGHGSGGGEHPTGCFYDDSTGAVAGGYSSAGGTEPINFDASRSNSIYGNSSTVQPQTIKILYYIVIATSVKTEIEVDIDEIATDLNGKADVDLTNCTDVANIKMAHNAMPSSTYVSLTLGASGTNYTAPADGWVMIKKHAGVTGEYFYLINNTAYLYYMIPNIPAGYEVGGYIPVSKGDSFQVLYNLTGVTNLFYFIYANGAESEAN